MKNIPIVYFVLCLSWIFLGNAVGSEKPDFDLEEVSRKIAMAALAANASSTMNETGNVGEFGGYVYIENGEYKFTTVNSDAGGAVQRGPAPAATVGAYHSHPPFANVPMWWNNVNFMPSKGDEERAYPGLKQNLGYEVPEYLITPDGGIRLFEHPVSDPKQFVMIKGAGFIKFPTK